MDFRDYVSITGVFAAVATWAGYLLNRWNSYESTRPELVFDEISFEPFYSEQHKALILNVDANEPVGVYIPGMSVSWAYRNSKPTMGRVLIRGVKNVGKGPAFRCFFGGQAAGWDNGSVEMLLGRQYADFIAAGDCKTAEYEVFIFWEGVASVYEGSSVKMCDFQLLLHYEDVRRNIYDVVYEFSANRVQRNVTGLWVFAPGLTGARRVARTTRVKLRMNSSKSVILIRSKFKALWELIKDPSKLDSL